MCYYICKASLVIPGTKQAWYYKAHHVTAEAINLMMVDTVQINNSISSWNIFWCLSINIVQPILRAASKRKIKQSNCYKIDNFQSSQVWYNPGYLPWYKELS